MWVSRRGGSPGEPPTPEQLEQWRRRMSPPEYEFPAGVGLTVLLGRSDDAAVGLTHLEVYSTGFRFTLAVRVRQPRPRFAGGRLSMLIGSHIQRLWPPQPATEPPQPPPPPRPTSGWFAEPPS